MPEGEQANGREGLGLMHFVVKCIPHENSRPDYIGNGNLSHKPGGRNPRDGGRKYTHTRAIRWDSLITLALGKEARYDIDVNT